MVNAVTLPKCSRSLSFEHAVLLTPLANTLSINRKSFSCLVKAGFIVVMPFHHRQLELYRVGVSTKSGHLCDDREVIEMDREMTEMD